MIKFVTRMFKKDERENTEDYQLPTDDPEVNPILVEDDGDDVPLQEIASLNSQLLAPADVQDPSGLSVRTRAVVEMQNGLTDLASHIRVLGQRLHAQSMGQSKLIEALSNLPQTIKEVLPDVQEQTNALAALKLAMDEQTAANKTFVDALKPLPKFVETAANLPEAARKQIVVLNELTKQLEDGNTKTQAQSEQVKVMVRTLAASTGKSAEQVTQVVTNLTKLQKAQLKQAALAVKSSELARRDQKRHHTEVAKNQQNRLAAMQRDQTRHFNRIEEHFKRNSRRQLAVAGTAVALAVAAVTFAVVMSSGSFSADKSDAAFPMADNTERVIDGNAVVER
jgi:chromosome segregation ATPase